VIAIRFVMFSPPVWVHNQAHKQGTTCRCTFPWNCCTFMAHHTFRASVTDHVTGTSFNVYSAEEVRKLSVKQIKVASAFDALGHCIAG
jgi:hypothetical protein